MPPKKASSKVEKSTPPKPPALRKIIDILSVIFYLIWIVLGVFFILFMIVSIRQGALDGLFGSRPQQQQEQVSAPTETTIPGIGKVNIKCVQDSLDANAIQKIVDDGNTSKLTDEEQAKLDPCIVEKEEAKSPEPSPENQ